LRLNSTKDFYVNRKTPHDEMLDEVTLSHLFRERNSFTKEGLSYSELLCKFLDERSLLPEGVSVLEIGPGIGSVAMGVRSFMHSKGREYDYKALDISEKILHKMREMGFDTILADCLEMKGMEEQFDLVIVNEVISDLPTIVDFNMRTDRADETAVDARRMIYQYGLDVPSYNFNFNHGAIKLLERVDGLLSERGAAFIAEQSSGKHHPVKVSISSHDEYTIDFGHLERAGRKMGFNVCRGKINDILGIDMERKFVSGLLRPDIKELYNLDRSNKKLQELMTGVFTPDEFIMKVVEAGALNIFNVQRYGGFIRNAAEPVDKLLDQFEFLLLRR